MDEWSTEVAGTTDPEGQFSFRGFHGLYDLVVEAPGGSEPVTVNLDLPIGSELFPVMVPLVPGSCFAAPEIEQLRVRPDPAGSSSLHWQPLPWREDMGRRYDLLRASDPADFLHAADCLESDDDADTKATDTQLPPVGTAWFYQVRGEYVCPEGSGSLGAGREGRDCTAD
jgi:hypothetical protein